MNDRFKFRVWDKLDEQYYDENCFQMQIESSGDLFIIGVGNDGEDCFWETDNTVVEQCTGLKDKNGELIYENDIIDTPNGIYRVAVDDFGLWTAIYKGNPLKDVVEWSDIVKNYAFNKENVEIVILGNIHQDKELLDE